MKYIRPVFFFRFWAPNSDRYSRLAQAYFEAKSADYTQLTQKFGDSKQNKSQICLTRAKSKQIVDLT